MAHHRLHLSPSKLPSPQYRLRDECHCLSGICTLGSAADSEECLLSDQAIQVAASETSCIWNSRLHCAAAAHLHQAATARSHWHSRQTNRQLRHLGQRTLYLLVQLQGLHYQAGSAYHLPTSLPATASEPKQQTIKSTVRPNLRYSIYGAPHTTCTTHASCYRYLSYLCKPLPDPLHILRYGTTVNFLAAPMTRKLRSL